MKIKINKVRTGDKKMWFDINHKNIEGIDTYSFLVQDYSGEKIYYKFIPYLPISISTAILYGRIEDII